MRTGLALCLLAVAPGAAAAQSGWDVFETRCLAPMSDVKAPDVTGLPRGGEAMMSEHWSAERAALMMGYAVSADVTLVIQPEGSADYPGCVLLIRGDDIEADWAASSDWLDAALADESWEQMGGSILGPHYLSTTWREPKLRFIRIDVREDGRVIIGVSETDLES